MKQILLVFVFSVLMSNARAEDFSRYTANQPYSYDESFQDAGFWDFFKPKKKEACRGNEAGNVDQCKKYNMRIELEGSCFGDDPEDTGIPAPCCCFG